MTLVSIVMAAQDAETTIGDSVGSVLAQTHAEWELIVVDDGSTDGTAHVVRSFDDPRVRLIEAGRMGVLARVRNRGIHEARGLWVAFLDADDVWLPAKLERQLAVLAERPAVGVVHTHWLRVLDGRREPARVGRREPLFSALIEDNFVLSSSALVRRSLLVEHGAFDPDPALWGSPDYELWLRLAPLTEFVYIDEPLVLYHIHPGQMTADHRRMCLGALAALEKARQRYPELAGRADLVWERRVGMLRCLGGLPGRGRPELLRVLRSAPLDRRAWKWLLRSFLPAVWLGAHQ